MAGNLESIHGKLGELLERGAVNEANLRNLGRNFDRHCADDDERHAENVAELREIRKALQDLRDIFKPLADAVAAMKPVVDGYQVTRLKFIGGLFVVGLVVSGLGWLITSIVGKAVEMMFRKLGLNVG